MRKAWLAGLVLLLGAASARGDEWTRQYALKGRADVRVTTDDGSVRIETADRAAVDARVTTKGWTIGPDQVTVTESQTGDRVEIEVRVPRNHWGMDRPPVDRVVVPVPGRPTSRSAPATA